MVICLVGNFTLSEANAFLIDVLDESVVPPPVAEYFAHPITCETCAWSLAPSGVNPETLQHVVDMHSVLEFAGHGADAAGRRFRED